MTANCSRAEAPEARAALVAWEARTGWTLAPMRGCPLCRLRVRHPSTVCPPTRLSDLPAAWDHVRGVRCAYTGLLGVLLQPYHFDGSKAGELTQWCARYGLTWLCLGTGWWHPATTAVLLTRQPVGWRDAPPTP